MLLSPLPPTLPLTDTIRLPIKDGLVDWDCAGAIDIPSMADSLSYIRQNASFPVFAQPQPQPSLSPFTHCLIADATPQPTLESKEDQNSVGKCPVPDEVIASLKTKVSEALAGTSAAGLPRVCLLDGFLLFSPSVSPVHPFLDVKLFLRTTYERAKARREARDGYVTLEGFWEDPPGYVDSIVWPNYVEEHAWMFEGGDVEGQPKRDVLDKEGIRIPEGDGLQQDMSVALGWAVDVLLEELLRRGGSK